MNEGFALIIVLTAWISLSLSVRIGFKTILRQPEQTHHFNWIAPAIGFLGWGWLTWILQWSLSAASLSTTYAPEIVTLVLSIGTCFAGMRLLKKSQSVDLIDPDFVIFCSVFCFIFLLCAGLCALHPEITWGERPMDSTFLRYFARMPSLPPNDPWAAGVPMRYYYFGSYLFGIASKFLHIPGGIAYPLGMASTYAVFLSGLIGIFRIAGLSLRRSFLGMILIGFTSNWNTLWGWLQNHRTGFDLFWDTSRVLTPPTFSEFPLWSFLFYDLHSHFIGLVPEAALIFCVLAGLSTLSGAWMGIAGFIFGILFFTNTWSWIAYSLLIALIFIFYRVPLKIWIPFMITAGTVGALFFVHMPQGNPVGAPHLFEGSHETLLQLMLFSGHLWITAIVIGIIGFVRFAKNGFQWTPHPLHLGLGLAILSAMIGLMIQSHLLETSPEWVLFTASAFLVAFFSISQNQGVQSRRIAWITILAGMILVCTSESIEWIDRMNTIFKWWIPAHLWIGVGGTILLMSMIRSRRVLGILLLIFFTPNLVSGWKIIDIQTQHAFILGPRPSLNGDLYLATYTPDESAAIQFLNQHVKGIETLSEAPGGHYDGRARIAQFTGLPIVMGWEHHSRQRGVPDFEIRSRIEKVDRLYTSTLPVEKLELARTLKIRWIVIGNKEIERYPEAGRLAFQLAPEFSLKFQQGNVRVFEVSQATAF